jgi:hypothetical protein
MVNSEKSSECGRWTPKFLPVLRRPFGIESQGENAFSKESQGTQSGRTPAPALVPKVTIRAATADLAVALSVGVIEADHDLSDDRE